MNDLSWKAIYAVLSEAGGGTTSANIRSLLLKPDCADPVAALLRVHRETTESDSQFAASLAYTLEKYGIVYYDQILDKLVLAARRLEDKGPGEVDVASGGTSVSSGLSAVTVAQVERLAASSASSASSRASQEDVDKVEAAASDFAQRRAELLALSASSPGWLQRMPASVSSSGTSVISSLSSGSTVPGEGSSDGSPVGVNEVPQSDAAPVDNVAAALLGRRPRSVPNQYIPLTKAQSALSVVPFRLSLPLRNRDLGK